MQQIDAATWYRLAKHQQNRQQEVEEISTRMTRRNEERFQKINENQRKSNKKNGKTATVYNMRLAREAQHVCCCGDENIVCLRASRDLNTRPGEMVYACYMHFMHSKPLNEFWSLGKAKTYVRHSMWAGNKFIRNWFHRNPIAAASNKKKK